MDKRELLLVALGQGGNDFHTPVQVQKLLFLIDKNIGERLGGPFFNFAPYDYGPFDSSIYEVLRDLERDELICSKAATNGMKIHGLTDKGLIKCNQLSQLIDPISIDYIKRVSEFVRSLSFPELVSAIYKAYPEMKLNSVFQDRTGK